MTPVSLKGMEGIVESWRAVTEKSSQLANTANQAQLPGLHEASASPNRTVRTALS